MYREPTMPDVNSESLDWNLFAPGYQIDPYVHYRWLRENAPVHRLKLPHGGHSVLVSRYDDVRAVLQDAEIFSSAVTADLNWLVFRDPPVHTKLRGVIARAFTPKAIDAFDDPVRRLTGECFDYLLRDRGGDAMTFATMLPIGVICLILGIPTGERGVMSRWSLQSLEVLGDIFRRPVSDAAHQGSAALVDFLRRVLADYRTKPNDSIGSTLVRFSLAGEASEEDILGFCQFLFVAGYETTMHTLSGALGILAQDPALFARLKGDFGLIPRFVEEVLRYRPALQATARIAMRDTEIGGVGVAKGDHIRVLLGDANMDPAVFPDPERFDIDRPNAAQHMTFGKGIHSCIGGPLARREMRFAVEHVLATALRVELDPTCQPVAHVGGSSNEYGFDSLPLIVEPVRAVRQIELAGHIEHQRLGRFVGAQCCNGFVRDGGAVARGKADTVEFDRPARHLNPAEASVGEAVVEAGARGQPAGVKIDVLMNMDRTRPPVAARDQA